MKILITGASGFIGSFIVEGALHRGMEVWAAVRATSSRRYLTDSRIHFIELDFSSEARLEEALRGFSFDYIVHAAGVTKCLHREDFFRVNTEGTRHLCQALLKLKIPLKRMVYMSSLSVFGAIREQRPYTEITDADTPHPNTAYGKSKSEAERYLDSIADRLPCVVLRPTGVYGPREKDYFMMVESIQRHMDFSVGFKRQEITFVYVTDVVQAVFLALEKGTPGHKYFLSDGCVYTSKDFSNLVHDALGRPWWIRVKAPLWVLRTITFAGEWYGRITGKMTVLNNDKYNILSQRNWRCDITPAERELGYRPRVKLAEGVSHTVSWYQQNGWI